MQREGMQEDRAVAEAIAARLQAAMPGHVVQAEPWGGASGYWWVVVRGVPGRGLGRAGRGGVQTVEEFGPGVLHALLTPAVDPATRPDPGQERPGTPGR